MQKIIYNRYGDADVLQLQDDFPLPDPKPHEVLVNVKAAGVNPVDYKIRNGSMRFLISRKFPKTPGSEIAGIVEKTGKKDSRFKKGDRVYGMTGMGGGGYAQYLCVDESYLSLIPERLSFQEAATIALAGSTAWQSLVDKGLISAGTHVLINGASGGVGMFGVQIAKFHHAIVTAVCSDKNIDFVKELGADFVINYKEKDFTTLPKKFDIVFDAVAMSSFSKSEKVLNKKGRYITTIPSFTRYIRTLINPFFSKKMFAFLVEPSGKTLDALNVLIFQDKLNTYIERSYPLHQASDAHKRIETGRVRGKLVLRTYD
ncbi:MAG: NAD(P)-dependent alcohol dehydrogenase [Bacteroidota bacterium]